jgi:hypothetical protein
MSHYSKILAVGIAVVGLSACSTANTYERTPYQSRTAGEGEVVHTMKKKEHHEYKANSMNECRHWKKRAMRAEEKLDRMEDRFQDSLRK